MEDDRSRTQSWRSISEPPIERRLDPREELGPGSEDLVPWVERLVAVVEQAGGTVVKIGIEFGAPEIRFRLPANASDDDYRRVRPELIAIQEQIP